MISLNDKPEEKTIAKRLVLLERGRDDAEINGIYYPKTHEAGKIYQFYLFTVARRRWNSRPPVERWEYSTRRFIPTKERSF
jgi:hypothetical protein